jgi:hypothetical protein
MTMAMNAVRADARGPKVLRIGVIEGARIIEERILHVGESVTIGADPSCTVMVSGERAPNKQVLFASEGARWSLALEGVTDGRVVSEGRVKSVRELSTTASKLMLDESSRGKVTACGVSVLFQFVEPPPIAPKPQLPRTILRRPLRELDWRYNACLAGFMALGFSAMGYVEFGYDPEIETMDIREEARLVRLAMAPSEPEPAPTPLAQGAAASSEPSSSSAAPSRSAARSSSSAPSGARPSASRDAQAQAAAAQRSAERAIDAAMAGLQSSSEFRALANALNSDRSAVAMIRNGQGLMDGSVESLAHVGGITTATSNHAGVQRTGLAASASVGHGGQLGVGRRVDGPSNIAAGVIPTEERVITTRVTTAGPSIDEPVGPAATEAIVRVFRNNIGGVRSCYVRALRNNPTLRGRLEIEFSIGTSGRVVGVPRVSGIQNAPELNDCIAARVRGYVFPVLEDVTPVMFPVTLEPGG